jgi:hypothetical protein
MAVAIEGQLADSGPHDIMSFVNSEASAEIRFGQAVNFGATDGSVLSPDNTSDVLAGIVVHSHDYSDSQLGTSGVKPTNMLNVLRKGRIWVRSEDAVSVGDRMFVRCVIAGAEKEGAIRTSSDSTDCIDAGVQGVFVTSCDAGELAILEVNMTAKPA